MTTTPVPVPVPGPAAGTGTGAPGVRPRPYPVVLHLDGAPCLVVGAGAVAAHKAVGLLGAGAAVTVVAPVIGDEVRSLADAAPHACGALAVEVRAYAPPEASAYRLVVAATGDPGVDGRVTVDALAGGALVNRAGSQDGGTGRDVPVAGTVLVPAVLRVGSVTVAVSTDGTGPALARWLRDRVAAGFDGDDVATLADLVGEARAELLAGGGGQVDWPSTLDRVAPLVAEGRIDEARGLLGGLVGTAMGGPAGVGPASSLGFPP